MNYPAFLTKIIPTGLNRASGSGTVLSPNLVATCGHVVAPEIYRRNGQRPSSLTEWKALNVELSEFIGQDLCHAITCDGEARVAKLIAVHETLDLVLLQLLKPVPFLPVLDILDVPARCTHMAYGVDHLDTVSKESLEPMTEQSQEAIQSQISTCNASIQEGSSGGPLISNQTATGPAIAGLAVLGGSKASHSRFINGNAIKELLRCVEDGHFLRGDVSRNADNYGFVSEFEVETNLSEYATGLKFMRVSGASDDDHGIYVSSRPLLCCEVGEFVSHGDSFTLAHLTEARVSEGLSVLGFEHLKLRLPRFSELQACYASSTQENQREIEPNRPATIFDVCETEQGDFCQMPLERPEWCSLDSNASKTMAAFTRQRSQLQSISNGYGGLANLACARVIVDN